MKKLPKKNTTLPPVKRPLKYERKLSKLLTQTNKLVLLPVLSSLIKEIKANPEEAPKLEEGNINELVEQGETLETEKIAQEKILSKTSELQTQFEKKTLRAAGIIMALAKIGIIGKINENIRTFLTSSISNVSDPDQNYKSITPSFDDLITQPEVMFKDVDVMNHVKLIKSIPSQFFEKVAKAIRDWKTGDLKQPLETRLKEIYKITDRRAKLIARDQMEKMTSETSKNQYLKMGITKYIWRTSDDERVVGDPSGLYPDGNMLHGDHYSRDGLVFDYRQPPFDGLPGWAINCRCEALPVVDKNKVLRKMMAASFSSGETLFENIEAD